MADTKDEETGEIVYTSDVKAKNFDAYGNLARGLTPEELSQTGTQKLILNDLSRAEARIRKIEPYQDKYNEALIAKSILEEKLAATKKGEILYSFCITSGGLIVGFGKSYFGANDTLGIILFVLGGLLILGGIVFKINWK